MKKLLAGLMLAVVMVAGCSSEEDELTDFYNAFQETVEVEKEIEPLTEEFNSLEEEKSELQQSLEDTSRDELPDISAQLVENTESRIEQLDAEASVMEDSRNAMESSRQYVEEISNESYKEKAQSLIDSMESRFTAHGETISSYKSVLEGEKEVFEYLGGEDISQDEVDQRLNSLNEEYQTVEDNTSAFSEETDKVNDIKQEIEELIQG